MWQGMQATVRCDEDGERGERLVMSGPTLAYVGASDEVLKRLDAEGADVEALTELSSLNSFRIPRCRLKPKPTGSSKVSSGSTARGAFSQLVCAREDRYVRRPPRSSGGRRAPMSTERNPIGPLIPSLTPAVNRRDTGEPSAGSRTKRNDKRTKQRKSNRL